MSYQQSPYLTRHVLDSLLPYEVKPYQSKPFLKTKQFYKPQQFIWNNPHRASDTMYKFYHKYNDQFANKKAPLISKMQQTQRKQSQANRIRKLTQIRQQTRQRFFTRQKQRQNLQYLAGTRRQFDNLDKSSVADNYSVLMNTKISNSLHNKKPSSMNNDIIPLKMSKKRQNTVGIQRSQDDDYSDNGMLITAAKKYSTVTHYHAKPSKYQPMIPSHIKSKVPPKSDPILKNIQQTYISGVQKADQRRKLIQKLIVSDTHRQQNVIRQDFQKQKQVNSKRMSQISKFQQQDYSKLDNKSIYKQL